VGIETYVKSIKNALDRMDNIISSEEIKLDSQESNSLDSISTQLKFILSYAESGRSFKQGLLDRKREDFKIVLERYPTRDAELMEAIENVYADLDAHDYNVGVVSQEMGGHYFDLITNKYLYYKDLMHKRVAPKDENYSSFMLANKISDNLYWANYTEAWVEHGIKNIQFFFLVNLFSYVGLASRVIGDFPHPDAKPLVKDIWKISRFYETDESEGTHMWLNPVELKEIRGWTLKRKMHLVDLKGNIVE